MTREPIYAAVFDYFSALTEGNAPLFKTATRVPTTWEAIPPEDTPALLMRQRSENQKHRQFMPPAWTLHIDLLIYVHTNGSLDKTAIPAQILNPLLDAIDGALVIDDFINNACTLGGRVTWAAFDGTTQIHLGTLGDDTVAIVPLVVFSTK